MNASSIAVNHNAYGTRNALSRIRVSDIALVFFIFATVAFNEGSLVSVLSKVFLLVVTVFECMTRRKSPINGFTVAALLFFAWCVASLSWSDMPTESADRIKTLLYQLICYGCVSALVLNNKEAMRICLVAFVASAAFSAIWILGIQGVRFTDNRYVDGAVSSGQLALTVMFSMLLCCLRWRTTHKTAYLALFACFGIALLLTSSRRDFIVLVLFLIIFATLNSTDVRKRAAMLIVGVAFAAIALFLCLNVDFLYQFVGRRLESFFQFVFWGGTGDASTTGRSRLIDFGMGLFQSSPINGHGIGTFESLFATTHGSWQTSADNNYVELLADTGIVGFALYYIPLAVFLVRWLKDLVSSGLEVKFAVSGVIAFSCIDFATVWIFSKCGMLMILFFYLLAKSSRRNDCEKSVDSRITFDRAGGMHVKDY